MPVSSLQRSGPWRYLLRVRVRVRVRDRVRVTWHSGRGKGFVRCHALFVLRMASRLVEREPS